MDRSYGRFIFNFFRNAKLVSKVVIPFYNPPLSEEEFQLLHILPTLDIVRFF